MGECSRFDDLLNASEEELSEQDQAALLEHARTCPDCRARLQDMARVAHLLSSQEVRPSQSAIHPTDMALAAFAVLGLRSPDAEAAVEHLASCPVCRQELAAVRLAIEQVEDVAGGAKSSPGNVAGARRAVFLTPRRAAAAIGAALCYAAMCLCFSAGLAHLLLAYALTGRGSGWALYWWPLKLIPGDSLRLWIFVVSSVGLGLALRNLALWLWRLGAHGEPTSTDNPEA